MVSVEVGMFLVMEQRKGTMRTKGHPDRKIGNQPNVSCQRIIALPWETGLAGSLTAEGFLAVPPSFS